MGKIADFLINCGLENAISAFSAHKIKFRQLTSLSRRELETLFPTIGERHTFKAAINRKRTEDKIKKRMKATRGWVVTDLSKMKGNFKPSNGGKTQTGGEIEEKSSAPHSKKNVAHIINTDKVATSTLLEMVEAILALHSEALIPKNRPDLELIDFEQGKLNCVVCPSKITPYLRKLSPVTWKVDNYKRHLDKFHADLKDSSTSSYIAAEVVMDDSSDDGQWSDSDNLPLRPLSPFDSLPFEFLAPHFMEPLFKGPLSPANDQLSSPAQSEATNLMFGDLSDEQPLTAVQLHGTESPGVLDPVSDAPMLARHSPDQSLPLRNNHLLIQTSTEMPMPNETNGMQLSIQDAQVPTVSFDPHTLLPLSENQSPMDDLPLDDQPGDEPLPPNIHSAELPPNPLEPVSEVCGNSHDQSMPTQAMMEMPITSESNGMLSFHDVPVPIAPSVPRTFELLPENQSTMDGAHPNEKPPEQSKLDGASKLMFDQQSGEESVLVHSSELPSDNMEQVSVPCVSLPVERNNSPNQKSPEETMVEIPLNDYTDDGHRCYSTLMRDDIPVRLDDTVYILRDIEISSNKEIATQPMQQKHTFKTIGNIDHSECDIFRVQKLWKDGEENRFVFGQHYLRPHETFYKATKKFYKNELVMVPIYEELPIELVMGQCWVLDPKTFCKGRPMPCDEAHVYICEQKVDKNRRVFSKLTRRECTQFAQSFQNFEEPLKISRDYSPHVVHES